MNKADKFLHIFHLFIVPVTIIVNYFMFAPEYNFSTLSKLVSELWPLYIVCISAHWGLVYASYKLNSK